MFCRTTPLRRRRFCAPDLGIGFKTSWCFHRDVIFVDADQSQELEGRWRRVSMGVQSNWLTKDKVRESSNPLQLYVFLMEPCKRGNDYSWSNEDEVAENLTPLQLDVLHALWGLPHGADCRSRPPGCQRGGEQDAASIAEALTEHPIETKVRREFKAGARNSSVMCTTSSMIHIGE